MRAPELAPDQREPRADDMLNTAPMSTGASLQRALRDIVSLSSLRKMRSSTRRSSPCQEAFSSSSSMFFLRVRAQPLLEPVDLGSQVGGGDAEDLGDLGQRSFFEVEQQHGSIERALRFDESAQDAAAVVRVDGTSLTAGSCSSAS